MRFLKPVLIFIMSILFIVFFTNCSDKQASETVTPSPTLTEIPKVTAAAGQLPSATANPTVPADNDTPTDNSAVDVDLTVLSSTMVYAEVYNIMVSSDDYIGKTIKMKGQFAVFAASEDGPYYYACLIADATACCQQGIEFVLSDDTLVYPDDYPELDSYITVSGEFQVYEEDGYLYCHLINAELIVE